MKNLIALLLLSAILLSCKKESVSIDATTEKIQQIKSMSNVSQKIVAFNMLTNDEKAIIWQSHLRDALKEYSLNSRQKDLINESIKIISSEIYDRETKNKYTGVLSILSFKAQKEFSNIDYARIFHSLNKKTPPTSSVEEERGDCKCASNAYCLLNNFTVCNTVNSCNQTQTGCGLFGLSNCTGICGAS
jgi:hypothetical protein